MNVLRGFAHYHVSFFIIIAWVINAFSLASANEASPSSKQIKINLQPASQTIVLGQKAIFNVIVSGKHVKFHFQWFKDGRFIDCHTSTLTINETRLSDAGKYKVKVRNATSSIVSDEAVLTINQPPIINQQPQTQTVDQGSPCTYSISANSPSGGTISFQWRKGGVAIADATNSIFSIFSVSPSDAGAYDVVVTNTLNGTTASSLSDTAILSVHEPPTIVIQPESQTVLPPDPMTFKVVATSSNGGTLSYVWEKNGTAIPDAITSVYTMASTEFTKNGLFRVTVIDGNLKTYSNFFWASAFIPSPVFAGDPVPVPNRPIKVLSSLSSDRYYPQGAFRLGYDETLKNPVWTSYVNFPVHQPFPVSTAVNTQDSRLGRPLASPRDYEGMSAAFDWFDNRFNTGQLIPKTDISNRYATLAGNDTAMMSNVAPQNSHELFQGRWAGLEKAIGGTNGGAKDGITADKGRIWIYTGPIFSNPTVFWNSIHSNNLKIAIPKAFYKIIVSDAVPDNPKVMALVLPNVFGWQDGLWNTQSTLLCTFITSVAHIESLTGLDFFPNLAQIAPNLDIPLWKSAVDVRGWGTPFEQPSGPNVHLISPDWITEYPTNSAITFLGAGTPCSDDAGTVITSLTWDFGDGSPVATGASVNHSFNRGTYIIKLTATDSSGASNTINRVINVNDGNLNPIIGYSPFTMKKNQPHTMTWRVMDDTTSPDQIAVFNWVDNTVLFPDPLLVSNNNGECSVLLSPAPDQTGITNLFFKATDKDGVSSLLKLKMDVVE